MITLQNITVHKSKKCIIQVPFLHITQGETTGLIGPNGAGKSTLLKAIALLEDEVSGKMTVNNEAIAISKSTTNDRRHFSFVFQQPLMLDTNVFNNIATGLKIRGLSKQEIQTKVSFWLEKLHISHLSKRHARTLSGGEAQRVALARALVTEPKILLLDEPFSALDLPTKRRIMIDLKNILADLEMTTIFISHDYQEIKFLCQQAIVLFKGEMKGKYELNTIPLDQFEKPLQEFLIEWQTPLFTE